MLQEDFYNGYTCMYITPIIQVFGEVEAQTMGHLKKGTW